MKARDHFPQIKTRLQVTLLHLFVESGCNLLLKLKFVVMINPHHNEMVDVVTKANFLFLQGWVMLVLRAKAYFHKGMRRSYSFYFLFVQDLGGKWWDCLYGKQSTLSVFDKDEWPWWCQRMKHNFNEGIRRVVSLCFLYVQGFGGLRQGGWCGLWW